MKQSKLFVFASVLALLGGAGPAAAQGRVLAGTLACNTSANIGDIVGSREALKCTFTPSIAGPAQSYSGTITKLGVDLGATARGVIAWLVYAPTSGQIGSLGGNYVGADAGASVGAGLGANVLVGGSNQTVMLQPVSIDGQLGLNLAIGFAELQLHRSQ